MAMLVGGNQANMFKNANQITIHDGQFIQYVAHWGTGFMALSSEVASSALWNARHDVEQPKCHENTRVAVLNSIKDWTLNRTNSEHIWPSRLSEASSMWIYGAAGAGKSAIARTIAEWCKKEEILLASFFFFRSDPLRNNFKRFIATLSYDIIQSVPDCRPIIELAVESDPHIFGRSLEDQMVHLILKPLSQVAEARAIAGGQPLPHVIIVDGLDECIETREQTSIIQLFSTALIQHPALRFKVLIASRPELAIRHSLNKVANPLSRIALSDNLEADKDINRYLEDNFREIKGKNPNKSHLPGDWPSKEDINTLVRKSSGQFIYPATVIKFLSSGKRIKARLRAILGVDPTPINSELPFRQLDAIYEHILNSAGDGDVEAVKQTTALCILYERCQFQYACTAADRTPGEIIAGILGLEIEHVDCILEELGSILTVTTIDVRLHHASITDFLYDPDRAGNLWVDEGLFWAKIGCYCLRSLFNVPKDLKEHESRGLVPKEAAWKEYWKKILIIALQQARPTEEVTLCLSSDFTALFEIQPDIQHEFTDLWSVFFYFLEERSLEIEDWKSVYHRHISTYDYWLAWKLSLSYPQNIPAAFLSFRPIPDIAHYVFPSRSATWPSSPTAYPRDLSPSGLWMKMFDEGQLPEVRAYVLNGQTQASAILHCIHFIVDCAATSGFVRFRPGPDRRKSRPWIWRRRLLASRHSPPYIRRCPKKTGKYHSSYAPFIPFRLARNRFVLTGPNLKLKLLDSALTSLLPLLKCATISPHLIFALRVALSLTCTRNVWHEAKEAMTTYLVNVAGLKPKRLDFVDTWRIVRRHQQKWPTNVSERITLQVKQPRFGNTT